MRINQFVAHASGISRRAADQVVAEGRIQVKGETAVTGQQVSAQDIVTLDGQPLHLPQYRLICLHKPVGYITSRTRQGKTPTIYELLPPELHSLKPIGRLDKESSGVLLLTDHGPTAQQLQHPSSQKWKRYEVTLDRSLPEPEEARLQQGVRLDDGISKLITHPLDTQRRRFEVRLQEGRNRQIRRSFQAVDRHVTGLHRTTFGPYTVRGLAPGTWKEVTIDL